MTIANKIRQIRTEKGMTQQQLAQRLGVSCQHISQYERGVRTPKLETVGSIAAALGVELLELMPESVLDPALVRELPARNELSDHARETLEQAETLLVKRALRYQNYQALFQATAEGDLQTLNAARGIPDAELEEILLDSFRQLNRRGKLEAVFRIAELETNPRFEA